MQGAFRLIVEFFFFAPIGFGIKNVRFFFTHLRFFFLRRFFAVIVRRKKSNSNVRV